MADELKSHSPSPWEELVSENMLGRIKTSALYNVFRRPLYSSEPDEYSKSLAHRLQPIDDPILRIASGKSTAEQEYREPSALQTWMKKSDANQSLVEKLGFIANFISPGVPRFPTPLPMDFASRMARAESMGFRMQPVYHGTATQGGVPFKAFDPASVGGRTSGAAAGRVGVSVSPNPDVANEFALLAAARNGGDPAVMPLLHRTERPSVLHLTGNEKNLEVASTLSQAFHEGGRDLVAMKNYTTPSGRTGETAVVVSNPNQLRSVNAAFDPAKRNSSDLMASYLFPPVATAGGLAALGRAIEQERAPRTIWD